MQYRINKDSLLTTLTIWDRYLKKKVHIITCGGTALTLLDVKESTNDIDIIVPEEKEYRYLFLRILEKEGLKI